LVTNKGFTSEVTVVRDSFWIPHVIGDTPKECAYGLARAIC